MMVFDSSLPTTSVLHRETSGDLAARGAWRTVSATVQLASGDDAHGLLEDPQFRSAWSDLARACSWATPWQSLDHAEIWFSVYRDTFEPLLVFQHGPSGELTGLLPLAENKKTGAIVHVGAHQAEYQVWLATESNADLFVQQAMHALAARYPGRRLSFQYLPPDAPIAWCQGRRWHGLRTILRKRWRPLLKLGAGSRVEESLRKKSNKSRINRLRRIGPVALVELGTPEERRRHFETIVDFCDLRQGAINASMPFRDDPRKRELWLRLMDRPGLVHTSALMVGDQVVAAHIGPIDGSTVSLGIIAHSPFLAEHSPGKLLMLMLARDLGQQGFETFDLTPDGAYKDRFADHTDVVHTLTVYFGPIGYTIESAKNRLRAAAAGFLSPETRRAVKRAKRAAQTRLQASWNQTLPALKSWAARRRVSYYSIPASDLATIEEADDLKVNCIADLLLFVPTAMRSKKQFLAQALQRLETGDQVYTLSQDGVLLHCAWVSVLSHRAGLDLPNNFEKSPDTLLIWEDFTLDCASTPAFRRRSLAQRLRAAAAVPASQSVLITLDDPKMLSVLGGEISRFQRYSARGGQENR